MMIKNSSSGRRLAARAMAGLAAAGVAPAAWAVGDLTGGPAVNQLNLHPAVTQIAADVHWLHWFLLVVCAVIFVAVFGVMFYSIIKHRKSVGHKSANFHESVTVEIAWTIVPFIIVTVMGLMATKTVVAMKDTSNADITIKTTGYQWKWGYDYIKGEGEGISFLSTLDTAQRQLSDAGTPQGDDYLLKVDNPVVVPVGRKIRIITTAADVIHSWMIPAFAVKQDAIPGFVRDTWFRAEKIGDYYGQCVELCGKEHAYMPIHVKVVSAEDYSAWVAGKMKEIAAKADDPNKVWKLEDLMARGEKLYNANCAVCHKANGAGAGPIKALDGSPVVLDKDHVKQILVLLNGQNNGAMPAWKSLSDTELAAVITYTKNAWGNRTGQVVQPLEVMDVRAGKIAASPAAPAATAAADAQPAAAMATEQVSTVAPGTAGLPLSVLFASGSADLDDSARGIVGTAIERLQGNPDAKVRLSGFVDSTGDAAANAELAKQRALNVRDQIMAAGITEDRIDMRKPEQIEAGGADMTFSRRVDIVGY